MKRLISDFRERKVLSRHISVSCISNCVPWNWPIYIGHVLDSSRTVNKANTTNTQFHFFSVLWTWGRFQCINFAEYSASIAAICSEEGRKVGKRSLNCKLTPNFNLKVLKVTNVLLVRHCLGVTSCNLFLLYLRMSLDGTYSFCFHRQQLIKWLFRLLPII